MRVAIVGAGVAGLACARALKKADLNPTVFEKSRGPGGRAATRRIEGYTFDTGATSIAPRGYQIGSVIHQELSTEGLVRVEKPIHTHDQGRISPGDPHKNKIERFVFEGGINQLGKRLAEGLDVRYETLVETIDRVPDGGYVVQGEVFDRVVLAVPMPQAQGLLENVGDPRRVTASVYRPCLSVLLGYDKPLDPPFHALINLETHPLTWLSVESAKCQGRAPQGHTALVAQMSPRYSRRMYDADPAVVIRDTVVDVKRLLGENFSQPVVTDLKKWRYSQPESVISFGALNPQGLDLLVLGDGAMGGRIELAYETGAMGAAYLLGA